MTIHDCNSTMKTIFGSLSSADVNLSSISHNDEKLILLCADFCPFANRALITLLEKEKDPTHPELFVQQEVCYFLGNKDPGYKILQATKQTNVPVLLHKGNIFVESDHISNYIDDLFSSSNNKEKKNLKPIDPIQRYNMNMFIQRHSNIVSLFYKFLKVQNNEIEQQQIISTQLDEQLQILNKDLQHKFEKDDGPYLCGQQFTIADIMNFPFIERIKIVLQYYRNYSIPKSFTALHDWYEQVSKRPSIQIVTANNKHRTLTSLKTHCFEKQNRDEYLIEIYQIYARNELSLAKQILSESGTPGNNTYAKYVQQQEQLLDLNDKAKQSNKREAKKARTTD